VKEYIKMYREDKDTELQNLYNLSHYLGHLVLIGNHKPKDYPNKPARLKEKEEKEETKEERKEMTDEEQNRVIDSLLNAYIIRV